MFNIEQYISYNSILEFVKTNNILFTVFITILIVRLKDVSKSNVYLAGIVYFTGTFFHELAHYIAALITTLRFPEKVSLFPKSEVIITNDLVSLFENDMQLGKNKVSYPQLLIMYSDLIVKKLVENGYKKGLSKEALEFFYNK